MKKKNSYHTLNLQQIPLCPICIGIFVGLLGSIILFKDLIVSYPGQVLWADNLDSRLIYWNVNWGYHIIFEQNAPGAVWNANSFYPHNATLAYSDSMLSIQFVFAPLRLIGISPLQALYLSLFSITVAGTVLTALGLSRTGYFNSTEILFITFTSHFTLNLIGFLYHYQLFGFQISPPFFIFLYLYLRDLKTRYLIATLFLYSFGVLFTIYLAPMLLVLAIIISIPMLVEKIKRIGIIKLLLKIGVTGLLLSAFFVCVLYFVQFKPYFEIFEKSPPQSLKEMTKYSADFSSIFSDFSIYSYWYRSMNKQSDGVWEYSYSPGFVLLGLCIGFIITIIVTIVKKDFSQTGIENNAFLRHVFLIFIVAIVLSWGPIYKNNHDIKLPYYYVSQIMLGLDRIRAPGRFGIFIGLPLGIFSISFIKMIMKNRYWRNFSHVVLFAVIMIDSFPEFPVYPFSIENESLYKEIAEEINPGTPILELPVYRGDHLSTIRNVLDQLDGSTIHWGRLVVGYGAKTTDQYKRLLWLDNMVQSEIYQPKEIIKFGKHQRIRYILIHLDRYSNDVTNNWISDLEDYEASINYITSDDALVLLK